MKYIYSLYAHFVHISNQHRKQFKSDLLRTLNVGHDHQFVCVNICIFLCLSIATLMKKFKPIVQNLKSERKRDIACQISHLIHSHWCGHEANDAAIV